MLEIAEVIKETPLGQEGACVSISAGIFLFEPEPGMLDKAYQQADRLHYEAKPEGKDRIVVR